MKRVKIGDFLFERKGKYKPSDKNIQGLKRIEKIDFNGNFHIGDKSSKTNMILAKQGDLVISGINVAKGAMGIYEGKEDVVATIHYSSYTFDKDIINVGYFKRFLKSAEFIRLLSEQIKGGIKTEIKPKHILPLEINLPDIETQKEIVKKFENVEIYIEDLNQEVLKQKTLLKKLRQSILQDAIEGKLTKEWREQNHDVESASVLLEKIKAEKERLVKEKKIKKQKPLPPISKEEVPFEIPESWVWCRLDDIVSLYNGSVRRGPFGSAITKDMFVKKGIGTYKVYEQKNAIQKNAHIGEYYISKKHYQELKNFSVQPGDIIISCAGTIGETYILPDNIDQGIINQALLKININNHVLLDMYFIYLFKSLTQKQVNEEAAGSAMKNMVSLKHLRSKVFFPLPPLQEQKEIVRKIENLFALCDELETQIENSKANSEMLMQAVLKEAFEEK